MTFCVSRGQLVWGFEFFDSGPCNVYHSSPQRVESRDFGLAEEASGRVLGYPAPHPLQRLCQVRCRYVKSL